MIDERFFVHQVMDKDSLDYTKMEKYLSVLQEIDTLGNQFHWMFDYSQNCFYYITRSSGIFPKREFAFIPGKGYKCLVENSHPDDIIYMLNTQKAAFEFFSDLKNEDKLNYKFSFKMRVLTKGGDYVPFNFQIKSAALDKNGNVWMSLAQGVPSQTDRQIKPLIINTLDDNLFISTDVRHSKKEYVLPKLTSREMDLINLLAKNKNKDEICVSLQISLSTFKFHRKNMLKKLNAPNCFIAVENARLLGLLKD